MPSLMDTAINLYRKFLGSAIPDQEGQGPSMVLYGDQAIAIAEATITQSRKLSFAANEYFEALSIGETKGAGERENAAANESARGSLASAIGLSLSGRRATSFLTSADIAGAQDLLLSAAGRHLPLVVHLNNQALATHGGSLGSGHEAFHLSLDSGFFTLFASNLQEAVDFTYIARRIAEQTLVPGLVAIDQEQTARAIQEVQFLSVEQVQMFLGSAEDEIAAPTASQQLLFGDVRRRVPAWHNLDKPVLQGALYGSDSFALGALANAPFFDASLSASMQEAFDRFKKLTGRHHAAVSVHGIEAADVVLLVQGAAVEPITLVADGLRKNKKQRIGVIGIHSLRPFPDDEILRCLGGKKKIVVMERLAANLADDSPLLREVRSSLGRAFGNTDIPHCYSVSYGLGGFPLRSSDLIALADKLISPSAWASTSTSTNGLCKENGYPEQIALGVDFHSDTKKHPKRQVLQDALARAYPGIEKLGLRSDKPAPDMQVDKTLSIAIKRISGQGYDSLSYDIAMLLHHLEGGMFRGRSGFSWETWGGACVDRLAFAEEDLLDAADDALVDLCLIVFDQAPGQQLSDKLTRLKIETGVRQGGVLIIPSDLTDAALWQSLSPRQRQSLQRQKLRVYKIPSLQKIVNTLTENESGYHQYHERIGQEYLLGSLFGTLLATNLLSLKERKILSSKEHLLKDHLLKGQLSNGIAEAEDIQSVCLNAFQRGLSDVCELNIADTTSELSNKNDTAREDSEAPVAVKHLGREDDQYDSLPRLWDQVGVLYRDGEKEALTADPYFATGTIAPLSSTFRDFSGINPLLPAFDASLCIGCGKCWTACPDSAIGAVAISPGNLLDSGIRLAGADSLRQVASQISARLISQGKKSELAATAGTAFQQAFSWLKEKMTLTEERQQAIEAGLEAINNSIGNLPLVVTDNFFHKAESQKKDSAELFSLAINADACKGCGICISACEPRALFAHLADEDPEHLTNTRELWNIYSQLPDTAADTIERVAQEPDIGALAALNLSRYCSLAMAGGDGAEPGSGEKIAMRMALAVTEYLQQPLVNRFAFDIKNILDEISQLINISLSAALPTDDLAALSKSLSQIRTPLVDLSTLATELEDAVEGHPIDTATLKRLVQLTGNLTELHWRITEGEQGLGRARFGLTLTPGSVASWAAAFPYNSFQSPVVVDMTGDAAQIAAGLVEGHLRNTCDSLVMVRKARLEIDKAVGSEFERAALNNLRWQDLNIDEKALCPPLILVGNDDVLAASGLSQVLWLLKSDLPVKVLVMADLDMGISALPYDQSLSRKNSTRGNIAFLAMAERKAYVAQTSISKFEHFYQSLQEAMKFPGPALIHVHAPSPKMHGFDCSATLEQARLAVDTRAFPLFRYDPQAQGVYGSRISLQGNLAPSQIWVTDDKDQALVPAHWALREKRFAAQFTPLSADDNSPTDIHAWFELDAEARKKRTPYFSIGNDDGNDAADDATETRYRIEHEFLHAMETQKQDWQMLQELCGLVTPFTAQVEEQAQEKVKAERQAELSTQKNEYEQQISNLETELRTEMAGKIRNQLLKLVQSRKA